MVWFRKHETVISTSEDADTDEQKAEAYLRSQSSNDHITALVRHYSINEVSDAIEQFAGIVLDDNTTLEIVERLRREYGIRPVENYNKPNYVSPDDYPEDQKDMRAYYAQRDERRAVSLKLSKQRR